MFWPAFFLPPETILSFPYVDGAFAWNNAWYVTRRLHHRSLPSLSQCSCVQLHRTGRGPLMTHSQAVGQCAYRSTGGRGVPQEQETVYGRGQPCLLHALRH
jgi:hypothetical protein